MDKAKIQSLTANYSRMQGLRGIPVGVLLFFVSFWAISNQGPTANLTAPLLVTGLVILAYGVIDRYYKNAFGQVRRTRLQRVREVVVSVLFIPVALLAFWADTANDWPFSAIGLVFFAAMVMEYVGATSTVKQTLFTYWENLAAGVVILVFSLLPLVGISWWQWLGVRSQLIGVLMVVGVVIVVAGIISHIRIVRALPLREE